MTTTINGILSNFISLFSIIGILVSESIPVCTSLNNFLPTEIVFTTFSLYEFIFFTFTELINLYLFSISLTTHFNAKTALFGLVTTGVSK